jgi:predicted nicotinamide N-methyase
VLELGAGTGFVSLLCAKHLATESMLVTDRDPTLLEQIDDCIAKNGLEKTKIRTGIWEWGSPLQVPRFSHDDETATERGLTGFDIALGADLVCHLVHYIWRETNWMMRSTTSTSSPCSSPQSEISSTITRCTSLSSPQQCGMKILSAHF